MQKINSKTLNREYEIFIGNKIEKEIIPLIKKRFISAAKVILVTNEKINQIYESKIEFFLEGLQRPYIKIVLADGERSKSLESLRFIYENMISSNIHRNDVLIAFGGGVIGDLSGFAAATFHRGINLIQYPTTLIGQIDSSIGGKVVVNFKDIKNIIGSFYQPHMVVSDQDYLNTLEVKEIKNGFAEMIKYGLVFDKTIIEYLEDITKKGKLTDQDIKKQVMGKDFLEIIQKCINIKKDIVEKDEFDLGIRQFLNFGHTIGHALERGGDLRELGHGQAVSIGIALALELSIRRFYIDKSIKKKTLKIFDSLGIEYGLPDIETDKIIETIKYDKKFTADKNRFILLKGVNKAVIEELDDRFLYEAIESYRTSDK